MQTRVLKPAANAYQYPLLIKRLLLSGLRYERSREIVYADRLRYDYRTLNQRIARLANVLSAAGVQPGDTVAVMDWDSHRYLECMFAIPMIGAVVHTINVRLSPEQIVYTMNHAEDRFVLVNGEFAPLYQAIAGQLTTVRKTLLLSDSEVRDAGLPDCLGEYESLLADAAPSYDFPDFDEDSVATTFYTTGTTGNPKGVCFTHRQLVLHTLAAAVTVGCREHPQLMGAGDVYMPITPMFHVHAWGLPYVATMLGLKQVYPGRYDPEKLIELWRREAVTFSHCVPTIVQMLLDAKAAQGTDFQGWKIIIGGSALPRGLYDAARARGMLLMAAYGMSETCPLIAGAHINDELLQADEETRHRHLLKAGVPVVLVDAAIQAPDGSFLPADGQSQGELVLRAPWLTQGYHNEAQKSEELWAGGWLHTGDVAVIDEMSNIEIRDRIKDVIKTGGEWLSSLALEGLISRHAAVREVAVIGVPDARWGERPFALLVLESGRRLDARGLRDFLEPAVAEGHINRWAIPQQIAVVEAIPKTSVGKLDKKRMRAEVSGWLEQGSALISTL